MVNYDVKHIIIILLLNLLAFPIYSQDFDYKYVVLFADKVDSEFSLEQPERFMSAAALERREQYKIPLVENDLPVSKDYIELLVAKGFDYISQSNWLNGVLVNADELIDVNELEEEPYISKVIWVSQQLDGGRTSVSVAYSSNLFWQSKQDIEYGVTSNQINMLNGQYLHREGWQGENMLIGVLDAGFSNVPNIDAFNELFNDNRLIATQDFVEYDDNVYESSGHGTSVLSIMAGELSGQYLGTAPNASYILLKTEDVKSEQLVEEFNYVLGLEYADQMGVDVINTSLGYTTFNHVEMNHMQSDLDGDHLIATVGADIAASKGMLIINSAGNSGGGGWQYVSIPSDGDSVLAIGAVNKQLQRSGFSGMGNPSIPNVKPNVMAQGEEVAVVNAAGEIVFGGGTSFSGPIIAGLAACLWQAFPEKNNIEIMRAIEKSSSQYLSPDNQMGYGIPDFQAAFALLYQDKYNLDSDLANISVFPNPFDKSITLTLPDKLDQDLQVNLINDIGQILNSKTISSASRKTTNLVFSNVSELNTGIYFLQVKTIDKVFIFKMIKV